MPKETIAMVLFTGVAFGLIWAYASLVLWSANERVPALIIGPLWLTAQIGSRLAIHPYLAGAIAPAAIGVLAAELFFAVARVRGA